MLNSWLDISVAWASFYEHDAPGLILSAIGNAHSASHKWVAKSIQTKRSKAVWKAMANYHIKPIAWKTGTQTPSSPNLKNGDGVLYFTFMGYDREISCGVWRGSVFSAKLYEITVKIHKVGFGTKKVCFLKKHQDFIGNYFYWQFTDLKYTFSCMPDVVSNFGIPTFFGTPCRIFLKSCICVCYLWRPVGL